MELSAIIEGCKQEDRSSQKALFDLFAPSMMNLCLRYSNNNQHDAEDLMQDGFIRVFNKIHLFRDFGSFEGWMKRIFINIAIRTYQKNKKWVIVGDVDFLTSTFSEPAVLAQLDQDEIMRRVNHLPKGYRIVFNLYVIDGFSHAEIGDMLGIRTSTSRSQLVKAKKILQESLSPTLRMSPITLSKST